MDKKILLLIENFPLTNWIFLLSEVYCIMNFPVLKNGNFGFFYIFFQMMQLVLHYDSCNDICVNNWFNNWYCIIILYHHVKLFFFKQMEILLLHMKISLSINNQYICDAGENCFVLRYSVVVFVLIFCTPFIREGFRPVFIWKYLVTVAN